MPSRPIRTVLLLSAAALALSACREDNRPAATGYGLPPTALAYDMPLAPEGEALPWSRPAPVGRLVSYDDGYAWAERAYAMDTAFYEAPPDYGFYYDEVQPWVWESEDHWTMYAEPISDGYRYYYYEPGDLYPYFVRDPDYGYGYDDYGRLVTLYTVTGVLLPVSDLDDRSEIAGRYWYRAHALRQAAPKAKRVRVAEDLWLARQPVIVQTQRPWLEAAVQREDWRAYRTRRESQDLRRFERERERREMTIARLNRDELRRVEQAARRERRDEPRYAALGVERDRGERSPADLRMQVRDREIRTALRHDERRGEAEREARGRGLVERERLERRDDRQRIEQAREARARQTAQAETRRQARPDAQDRMQAERDTRRQQMAQAQSERRGRQEAQERERARVEREGRRQQMAQAEAERRGRQDAEMRQRARAEQEVRQRQTRVESERRGREQARAQQEARSRQEAQVRQQQARAEGERQARVQQEARAQREAQGRQQAQQQARAEGERRGREQGRTEARSAGQEARDAGGRERGGGKKD